jgi:tRNA(fMet)-specific endonuclease VapC
VTRTYLLDTNIISDVARNPKGRAAWRMLEVGEDRIFVSVIVLAEIRYGLERNPLARAAAQIEQLIDGLDIRDLPYKSARHYAKIRHALERQGRQIGANDYWIAAHAMAEDAVLVSNNMREFARVPNLHVENWLEQT